MTRVYSEGKEECNHIYIPKNIGELTFDPLGHRVYRACALCGRRELVTTVVDNSNPFTYDAIVERFNKE